MRKIVLAAVLLFVSTVGALAQSVGGNISPSVTAASQPFQLPANIVNYSAIFINYTALVTSPPTVEVFYALGTSNAITATTSSPALPFGGICINVGPNTWIGLIGSAAGPTTIRITQLTVCPGGR